MGTHNYVYTMIMYIDRHTHILSDDFSCIVVMGGGINAFPKTCKKKFFVFLLLLLLIAFVISLQELIPLYISLL